jgi:hypothetical protein
LYVNKKLEAEQRSKILDASTTQILPFKPYTISLLLSEKEVQAFFLNMSGDWEKAGKEQVLGLLMPEPLFSEDRLLF